MLIKKISINLDGDLVIIQILKIVRDKEDRLHFWLEPRFMHLSTKSQLAFAALYVVPFFWFKSNRLVLSNSY